MAGKKIATRKAQIFDAEGFGKVFKTKRTIEKNYTIRDMADILGLPNATFSRIEHGKPVEMNTVLLICDWLGRSVCDFIIYEKVLAFPIIIE